MARLISLDTLPKRSRHISEVSIGLAIVALGFMVAEWAVAPSNDALGTAFVQVVLAVVCLAVGAIYLFGDQDNLDDGSAVIDLRDDEAATDTVRRVVPRQVPDARDGRTFAT